MKNGKIFSVGVVFFLVAGVMVYLFMFDSPNTKNNKARTVPPKNLETHENIESSAFQIYRKVTFDNHPRGYYKQEQFSSDWKTGEKLYQPNTTRIDTIGDNKVLANYYPEGTFGRGGGLNQFGNLDGEMLEEVYLSYRFMFENSWEWGLAGKMPGFIYGSVGNVASGGDGPNIGDKGSSVRLIWNDEGKLNFYIYHHEMNEKYGESLDAEFFGPLELGVWHTITMRLVSNDLDKKNGICQVWLNGELKASLTNLKLRTPSSPKFVEGVTLSTFMGGADDRFASPKSQTLYMDDFYVWGYTDQFKEEDMNLKGNRVIEKSTKLFTPLNSKIKEE